jgi:hypothetical protein
VPKGSAVGQIGEISGKALDHHTAALATDNGDIKLSLYEFILPGAIKR